MAKRKAGSPEPAAAPRYIVTTVRLTPAQWHALRTAALERSAARGGGKPDASEVLREVLDEWMARRRK